MILSVFIWTETAACGWHKMEDAMSVQETTTSAKPKTPFAEMASALGDNVCQVCGKKALHVKGKDGKPYTHFAGYEILAETQVGTKDGKPDGEPVISLRKTGQFVHNQSEDFKLGWDENRCCTSRLKKAIREQEEKVWKEEGRKLPNTKINPTTALTTFWRFLKERRESNKNITGVLTTLGMGRATLGDAMREQVPGLVAETEAALAVSDETPRKPGKHERGKGGKPKGKSRGRKNRDEDEGGD